MSLPVNAGRLTKGAQQSTALPHTTLPLIPPRKPSLPLFLSHEFQQLNSDIRRSTRAGATASRLLPFWQPRRCLKGCSSLPPPTLPFPSSRLCIPSATLLVSVPPTPSPQKGDISLKTVSSSVARALWTYSYFELFSSSDESTNHRHEPREHVRTCTCKMCFSCSAVSFSKHLLPHSPLTYISGLLSSCRVTPRLPSGLTTSPRLSSHHRAHSPQIPHLT